MIQFKARLAMAGSHRLEFVGEIEAEISIQLKKRFVAELVGTFGLVFAAVGSSVANSLYDRSLGQFAVAAAPGLIIMAMTFALDKISGAYFNPAISLCFAISGHLKPKDLPFYLIAQVIGAVVASFLVILAIGQAGDAGLTLPKGKGGWVQAFIVEVILTFFLMFVSISMRASQVLDTKLLVPLQLALQ